MNKKISLLGSGLLLGLALSGCNSSGSGTGVPVNAGDVVGTWYFRSAHTTGVIKSQGSINGTPYNNTQNIDTTETYTGTTYSITFAAGGTYSANYPDQNAAPKRAATAASETGTWTTSGSTLTTKSSTNNVTVIQNVSVSGNTMTGDMIEDTTSSYLGITITTDIDSKVTLSKQ